MLRPADALALLAIGMTPCLGGCGTYVPDIQENPFATEAERSDFIQAVVRNVRCEVQDAVVKLYAENAPIDPNNRNLRWFDTWAAQISLTLTIDEKSALNPTLSWLPPSLPTNIFNLNLGASASAEAWRVDKIGSFFLVSELKNYKACPPAARHRGPFILESDLKLYDWLEATMVSINNRDTPVEADANGPQKSNVLSHQVKFEIDTGGNITPVYKLRRFNVNSSANLFTTSRNRTQDLTITFGPPDQNFREIVIDPRTKAPMIDAATHQVVTRPTALAPAAASAAYSADVSNAITNGIRAALRE